MRCFLLSCFVPTPRYWVPVIDRSTAGAGAWSSIPDSRGQGRRRVQQCEDRHADGKLLRANPCRRKVTFPKAPEKMTNRLSAAASPLIVALALLAACGEAPPSPEEALRQ